MPGKHDKSWDTLSGELIDEFAPLLTEDTVRRLRVELDRLSAGRPNSSGLGIDHPGFTPALLPDALEALARMRARYLYWRRLAFVLELLEKDQRRKGERLARENVRLAADNRSLRQDKQRLTWQLHKLLGIREQSEEDAEPAPSETPAPAPKTRRRRGAPRGHRGATRPIPSHIDQIEVVHAPRVCEHCGSHEVRESQEFDSRYIEDIPPVVRVVTHRQYRQGVCRTCGCRVHHPEAFNGPPVVTGPRLAALLAHLRHLMGASHRKLAALCTTVFQLPLTPSGALGILNRTSDSLEPAYEAIAERLPDAPVAFADETGWHMDGAHWQLWCVATRRLVYYHADPSRARAVIVDILGADFAGVLHCDFYAAYDVFEKLQRCLVHLLRDIREELAVVPNEPGLLAMKTVLQYVVKEGVALRQRPLPPAQHARMKRKLLDQLLAVARHPSAHARTIVLQKRIVKHQDHLLRFVDDVRVDFHNNHSERLIRPGVIFRKLSFGHRTVEGAHRFAILASVFQSCRLQNRHANPILDAACSDNLTALRSEITVLINSS